MNLYCSDYPKLHPCQLWVSERQEILANSSEAQQLPSHAPGTSMYLSNTSPVHETGAPRMHSTLLHTHCSYTIHI